MAQGSCGVEWVNESHEVFLKAWGGREARPIAVTRLSRKPRAA